MFLHNTIVRLHDTDAAGRLYFAHQFRMAHEAYEAFLDHCGLGLPALIEKGRFVLPIVHAAADFRSPLRLGHELCIGVKPQRIGKTSFALVYRFTSDAKTVGHVTTVHVALDARTGQKRPLPARLRAALQRTARAS